jgi:hypothetical protein
MEPNAEVLPKVPSKEKTEPGPEGVFEEKKPDEVVAKPPGVKVPDGKPPEEVKPRPEAKPDESKPPEEKKDESNEPATERRKSLPISKPNKGGVSTKASRAIAEMKANMDKKGIPMKKEGRKKKVLTLSQQMDAQMTVRDDQVFKAKMAQTIERWDGKDIMLDNLTNVHCPLIACYSILLLGLRYWVRFYLFSRNGFLD